MADVTPFRALRYDPARVAMASVVTQPYDKITPAMQARYYAAGEHNLVRVILGRAEAGDDEQHNVYTRAAATLREWRQGGILRQDAEPAFYACSQRFTPPGGGVELERRGFIGLGRLEDYSAGVVFRHEQTLSGPKLDRLRLLRATRVHCEQLFLLYRDPGRRIEQRLPLDQPPEVEVRDEYGVLHRLWRVTGQEETAAIRAVMQEQKLILADGHHRYETALAYRDQRRVEAGRAEPGAPWERVMMTFVNTESEGLLILPTHRVLFGLAGFDPEAALNAACAYFEVHPAGVALDANRAGELLQVAPPERPCFLAVTRRHAHLLTARPDAADALPAGLSQAQQALDVVHLHRVLLERVLGISEEAIRAQANLRYLRDASEALEEVRRGADAAFLLRPARVAQVRDIALAGGVMPQKSTDFYPKLLSGLVLYALE